jgi:hypothetical protein
MEERRIMKCQDINTLASTAENSYPQTTMYVPSAENSIQLDLNDAQNAKTQLKQDKSNAAAVACHFRQPAQIVENSPSLETTAKTVTKDSPLSVQNAKQNKHL